MATEFAYSSTVKTFWRWALSLTIVGFTLFLAFVGHLSGDAILAILLLCGLAAVVLLIYETKLRIDDEGIRINNIAYRQFIKWSDIDDVVRLPQLLIISSYTKNKRIRIDENDFGLSLAQFDELQALVKNRIGRCLVGKWQVNTPPITFRYPGLYWGTAIAYALPVCVTLFFFVLFVRIEGQLWSKFIFLFLGILAVVPFLLRDYWRTRKRLIIENEGLRQLNGKEIFIPWQAVASVEVRKVTPTSLSIIVESNEGRTIQFPQSIMNCGQILYWIKRRTNLPEFIAND
jgi:hypothetical protein